MEDNVIGPPGKSDSLLMGDGWDLERKLSRKWIAELKSLKGVCRPFLDEARNTCSFT